MTGRYTHTLDVAFSVYSDHPHWDDVPTRDLLAALRDRLDDLLREDPDYVKEAFGHVETIDEAE